MNVLHRVKTTLTRQLGKTFILFLLVLILGVCISGALSVQGAILNLDANMQRNMNPLVSIEINGALSDAHAERYDELPLAGFLTPEIVRDVALLPYVADFVYFVEAGGTSTELLEYDYGRTRHEEEQGVEYIILYGTSTTELIQVSQGIVEITQGRTFTENELTTLSTVSPIIISERFAQLNQLLIGSTFILDVEINEAETTEQFFDPHFDSDSMPIIAHETFEFEVVGIFDITERETFEGHGLHPDERDTLLSRERERISRLSTMSHVPNIVAEQIQNFEAQHLPQALHAHPDSLASMEQDGFAEQVSAMFLLRDPLEIEDFTQAVTPLLPSEFWQVNYLVNDFDHIATTMENMRDIANWVLLGTIVTAILIVSLLISLFLNDRKHEIGIYLALGEKKRKIMLQILSEVIVVTFIGISIALFVGNIASDALTRELLRIEVMIPREREFENTLLQMGFMQSAPDIYPEELMEIFDISLDVHTIVVFYLIGLGTVIVSTLLPAFYVVKMNPKEVLM